jgi:hypothetical protein
MEAEVRLPPVLVLVNLPFFILEMRGRKGWGCSLSLKKP